MLSCTYYICTCMRVKMTYRHTNTSAYLLACHDNRTYMAPYRNAYQQQPALQYGNVKSESIWNKNCKITLRQIISITKACIFSLCKLHRFLLAFPWLSKYYCCSKVKRLSAQFRGNLLKLNSYSEYKSKCIPII